MNNITYTKNKKAYHDYEMLDSIEAGISLKGSEVKSIRKGQVNLLGSFVYIEGNKIILKQCHISRPDHIGKVSHEEERPKPLLLNKSEIKKLHKEVQIEGLTLIVTEIYQREGTKNIKCKLNIAKGKKNYDKRKVLKEKQADIDVKRQIKDY